MGDRTSGLGDQEVDLRTTQGLSVQGQPRQARGRVFELDWTRASVASIRISASTPKPLSPLRQPPPRPADDRLPFGRLPCRRATRPSI